MRWDQFYFSKIEKSMSKSHRNSSETCLALCHSIKSLGTVSYSLATTTHDCLIQLIGTMPCDGRSIGTMPCDWLIQLALRPVTDYALWLTHSVGTMPCDWLIQVALRPVIDSFTWHNALTHSSVAPCDQNLNLLNTDFILHSEKFLAMCVLPWSCGYVLPILMSAYVGQQCLKF